MNSPFSPDQAVSWELTQTLNFSRPEYRDCIFIQSKTLVFELSDPLDFGRGLIWSLFRRLPCHKRRELRRGWHARREKRQWLTRARRWLDLDATFLYDSQSKAEEPSIALTNPKANNCNTLRVAPGGGPRTSEPLDEGMWIEELTMIMEGLFGPITQLRPIFGVTGFLEVCGDTSIKYNLDPMRGNQPVAAETIENLVSAAPWLSGP
jgi:hypothetical protein